MLPGIVVDTLITTFEAVITMQIGEILAKKLMLFMNLI